MLLSALLTNPVVCIEHPPLCGPGNPSRLFCACCAGLACGTIWQEVAWPASPARLHTGNVRQENSTGQTSCAASAMGNAPQNILSTKLQDRRAPGWAGSRDDAAGGNWLKVCLMSAQLRFYWDIQWKKMVIILLKNNGCLFLLRGNSWLVHQHCCVSVPEVRCGGF